MAQTGTIIGREAELTLLNKTLGSDQAEFIAVYGRRRVGKTYLISTFFKDKGVYFEFIGIKDANTKMHLKSFANILSSTFPKHTEAVPRDWLTALDSLRKNIEMISKDKKVILFFDELPWIASPKSNFLQALDNCWNRYLSRMSNLILVVCGSAASWMIDNIIANTGGLHGRLTRKIHLQPFTLIETKKFLEFKHIDLDHKQIIELYMSMGGIPKYLMQAEPGQSAMQIINQQFFTTTGYLAEEFNKLYSSLFNNYENHIKVIRTLSKSQSGLARGELLDKSGIGSGGTATKVIRELEESGFIMHLDCYPIKKPMAKYRLIDQFSLFYLKWVDPAIKFSYSNNLQNYWMQQANTKAWQIWCGYAFENVCLLHLAAIQNALGIRGINLTPHVWYTKGTAKQSGAQIDLLLDRADNCINLCEIKFYNTEFEVTKEYGMALERKKEIFREATSCKKSLFTTLITTYGTIKNNNANQYIQSDLTINDLFGSL